MLDVRPEPNTTFEVDVPVEMLTATVVLNEQLGPTGEPFDPATDEEITVNAVHITLSNAEGIQQEVIIASSQCSFHAADAPGAGRHRLPADLQAG